MNSVPLVVLVNLTSDEKHCLNSIECVIGRNWLKCDDKRISRNHGVLKVLSQNSIALISTHENALFYRKKDDPQINLINKGDEVNLFVGDSFGLLVDQFWFSINIPRDDVDTMNGSAIVNGTKRPGSADSEPDSTTKRIKTEPNELNDEQIGMDTTLLTNDQQNPSNDGTSNDVPSTSNQPSNIPIESPNSIGPVHRPIKLEPIDSDANEAQPIKTEPQDDVIDSTNIPIKTEIKEEPSDERAPATTNSPDETSAVAQTDQQHEQNQPNQPNQPARRECCRYGIRCYRRNPLHRSDEAHPGDADYRLPNYPDPPLGAPPCPFLDRCYRRNPSHFRQFSHKTDLSGNKKKDGYEATAQTPNRTTAANYANQRDDDDDDDDESEEDPFASDDGSEDEFADPGSASESDDPFDADTDEAENE